MQKTGRGRLYVLYGVTILIGIVILIRLYVMQIQGGEEARKKVISELYTAAEPAKRGAITDRYGRVMVQSKYGYRVVIEQNGSGKDELCHSILGVFSLLSEEEKREYTDTIPISFQAPYTYSFPEEAEAFQKEQGFSRDCFPEEAIRLLSKTYQLKEDFSLEEKRVLCGVFLGMEQEGFSASLPYILAENISAETVMRLKEQAHRIPAAKVQSCYIREYLYPETAVHLLGRVGKISAAEYEEKKTSGYCLTDEIGKQGAEKAFESVLRGKDGKKAHPSYEDFVPSEEAVPGDAVILTVDLSLQQATEKALEEAMHRTRFPKENGAAAVVLDVHTGEILASASYPDYDITDFNKEYAQLSRAKAKPMFHRSFAGLYAPGSTFKPISAIAAVSQGVIHPEETVETKGAYRYLDRVFRCNIYRTTGETHGTVNMAEALGVSCNYYFYELGKRTGIEAIAETAKQFGLGEKACPELSFEEATGAVASPELRERQGGVWYPGDTLQAAIGQADHLFTPIQLANYTAAIANGGKLYPVKLLKATKSGSSAIVTDTNKTAPIRTISIPEEALSAVREGMCMVTAQGGTAGDVFADFPVSVAGKTGSAQVPGGTNGLFIGYAPANNPQIALCTVIENGGAGRLAAMAAKDIFAAYFEK